MITYIFITSFTLTIDTHVGRHTWKEALLFPGLVNVTILVAAVLPGPVSWIGHELAAAVGVGVTLGWVRAIELFTYIWLSACMGVAFLGKVTESRRFGRVLGPLFVYIGGYGPLLCAITTAAYLKELRHAEATWDKTEKTGKMVVPT